MALKTLWIAAIFIVVCSNNLFATSATGSLVSEAQRAELNKLVDSVMADTQIVGQSIVILQNGKLVFARNDGWTDIQRQQKVGEDSIYPVYSITKLFTAALIAKLANEGKLDLKQTASHYLGSLPLHWRHIKVSELLAHSSGLPEFFSLHADISENPQAIIKQLQNKPMSFPTNSQTQYNQTNFLLLKLIIEKLHGKELQSVIKSEFTQPWQLNRTGYYRKDDSTPGRIIDYYNIEQGQPKNIDVPEFTTTMYAATGLSASIADLASWFQKLISGKYIPLATWEEFWQPFYLLDGSIAEYSSGWQYQQDETVTAVGHYGGNSINVRHFYLNDDIGQSVTILHLTNGGMPSAFSMFDFSYELANIVNPAINLSIIELKRKLLKLAQNNKFIQLKAHYQAYKKDPNKRNIYTGQVLNDIGWQILDVTPAVATEVFKLYLDTYPKSAIAHDSYAEGLYRSGNYPEAKRYFQKALQMNPSFSHIPELLKTIDQAIAK